MDPHIEISGEHETAVFECLFSVSMLGQHIWIYTVYFVIALAGSA